MTSGAQPEKPNAEVSAGSMAGPSSSSSNGGSLCIGGCASRSTPLRPRSATVRLSASSFAPARSAQERSFACESVSSAASLPSTPSMKTGRLITSSVASIAAMPTMAARELAISELSLKMPKGSSLGAIVFGSDA